jgi:hypothetical protein
MGTSKDNFEMNWMNMEHRQKNKNKPCKEYFHHLKEFLNDFKKLQNDIFMRMFLGTPSHNNIMQHCFCHST